MMVTKQGKGVLSIWDFGHVHCPGRSQGIIRGPWILPFLSGKTAGDFPLVLLSAYFSFLSLPHVTAASLQREQLIPSLHMAGLVPTHCLHPLTLLLGSLLTCFCTSHCLLCCHCLCYPWIYCYFPDSATSSKV